MRRISPVIVVSGDSTIDAAIRALCGGAADFVRKPHEPEELLRRVDRQPMVAMGRGMNLTVIAEGVETDAQRDRLQQMQCHEMQGYYFSPPLSAHAATALLSRDARGFEQDGQRVAV